MESGALNTTQMSYITDENINPISSATKSSFHSVHLLIIGLIFIFIAAAWQNSCPVVWRRWRWFPVLLTICHCFNAFMTGLRPVNSKTNHIKSNKSKLSICYIALTF